MDDGNAIDPKKSSGSKEGFTKRLLSECCGEEKEYLPYQFYFFSFFAGIGAFMPYLVLYFKQLGLSASQAGILYGMRPLSELFVPLWGWVGDKYKMRKTILQLALISYALSALVTLAVQPKHQKCVELEGNLNHTINLEFSRGGVVNLEHPLVGPATWNGSRIHQRELDLKELDRIFTLIFLITLLGQIIGCVVFTFPEALTVALLEDKGSKFGMVRFFGEISISVSSFAMGAALSGTEHEVCGQKFKNYSITFYTLAAWISAALITTIWLKTKYHDPRPEISLGEFAKATIDLKSISLLIVSVFLGSFYGLHESFGLWFIEDLGGSSLMMGIAVGLRYSFATLGYITSQFFIARYGVVGTLAASLFLYGFVFCGFSLAHSPKVAAVFFVLQGLYSLSWCSVVAYVGQISQETGYTASIQGVFGGLYWGLGFGGGAILSGVLVESFGVRITYQCFAVVSMLLCAVLFCFYWLEKRKKSGRDDLQYERLTLVAKHENKQ